MKDLSATNAQMSIGIEKRDEVICGKDEIISLLHAQVNDLRLQLAGHSLTVLAREEEGELGTITPEDIFAWTPSETSDEKNIA